MTPLRVTALIDAPEGAVRRVLRRSDVWTRTAHALGGRAEVAGPRPGPMAPLCDGALIRVRAHPARRSVVGPDWSSLLGSRSLILRVGIDGSSSQPGAIPNGDSGSTAVATEQAAALVTLSLVAGPLRSCDVTITTARTATGTLVTVDCLVLAAPAMRTALLRRRVLRAARMLLGIANLAAREVQVVVAGAVIRNERVLAARRTRPPELAGLWELPGGKVDPGETEPQALVRELFEELGVTVEVGHRIGPDVDLGDNMVLRCYRATTDGEEVSPVEHDEVRWIGSGELDTVPWVQADSSLVQLLGRDVGPEVGPEVCP